MAVFFPSFLSVVLAAAMLGLPCVHAERSSAHELPAEPAPFHLRLRHRTPIKPGSNRFHRVFHPIRWQPRKTAVVVCDMWDLHHCLNATRRVAELAPRVNRFVDRARTQGAWIIHAPSDCMAAYTEHPARLRAQAAPQSKNLPAEIGQWCDRIPAEAQGVYPIDQSDGGEDDDPKEHAQWAAQLEAIGRDPRQPWKQQTAEIPIAADTDFISDDGAEIWNVLEQHGINNVMLVGVHANMCVLGRPFGLRQMAKNGKHVVLVRDLTDTMYNPASRPFVSHFTATDLIVEHIEKWVCPTITSDQLLGGQPFRFRADRRPRLVIVSAEREYRTEQTLPAFARKYLGKTFQVSYVFADENDRNNLPGLGILGDADIALISVRRRVLRPRQMQLVKDFIAAGKPVVGVRTASHAFVLRDQSPPDGYVDWPKWDHDIFGGHYTNHLGNGPEVRVSSAAKAAEHPLLRGIEGARLVSHGSLYQVRPLNPGTTPLLMGSIPGHPAEPVAWTYHTPSGGRAFYMSIAHPDDFAQPGINRLLSNAIHWAAGLDVNPGGEVGGTRNRGS